MSAKKISKIAEYDPVWVRYGLIAVSLGTIFLFLIFPLITIFIQAFAKGWSAYWNELTDFNTLAAIRLTLLVALITVPLTCVFGVASAWAIARFEFKGKSLLI